MKTISDDPKKDILDFRTTQDQQYFDPWENRLVTVRYAGICIACHRRKVYQPLSKDGHPYDPDPRGIFGQEHAAAHLVASEYGMTGIDYPLCFECSNTREKYERALADAKSHWKEAV